MSNIIRQPRRVSFQKRYKGNPSNSKIISRLKWGSIGLRSCELGRITNLQLNVAIRFLSYYLPRGVQLIVRIFPDIPITTKTVGTRIGKGKGSVTYWGVYVKKGQILFEVVGVNSTSGSKAFQIIKAKLPVLSVLVFRRKALK